MSITNYPFLDYKVMDSDEKADALIRAFKRAWLSDMDINDTNVQEYVFREAGCRLDDLFEYDKNRVIREVEKYAKSYRDYI